MSEIETVLDLPPGDRFYGNRSVSEHQALLASRGEQGLSARLDELLLLRKTRRKDIRAEVLEDELQKINADQEVALKMDLSAEGDNTGRRKFLRVSKGARSSVANQNLTNVTSDIMSAAEIAAMELQQEDCDNGYADLLEDIANQGNRMQPTEWEALPECVQIAVQVDHNEELTNDNTVLKRVEFREAWIKMWAAKVSRRASAI